jgi:hypothetical protein
VNKDVLKEIDKSYLIKTENQLTEKHKLITKQMECTNDYITSTDPSKSTLENLIKCIELN